ncbi:MAG: hypothetical protein ACOC5T_02545 [Elusimicrobiota bacterium]
MIEWKYTKNNPSNNIELEEFMDVLVRIDKCNKKVEKEVSAHFIENWLDKLEDDEASFISSDFSPIAFALVRRTFPDLFSNKVCGVQPMTQPVGLAYAMRIIYNEDIDDEEILE